MYSWHSRLKKPAPLKSVAGSVPCVNARPASGVMAALRRGTKLFCTKWRAPLQTERDLKIEVLRKPGKQSDAGGSIRPDLLASEGTSRPDALRIGVQVWATEAAWRYSRPAGGGCAELAEHGSGHLPTHVFPPLCLERCAWLPGESLCPKRPQRVLQTLNKK